MRNVTVGEENRTPCYRPRSTNDERIWGGNSGDRAGKKNKKLCFLHATDREREREREIYGSEIETTTKNIFIAQVESNIQTERGTRNNLIDVDAIPMSEPALNRECLFLSLWRLRYNVT